MSSIGSADTNLAPLLDRIAQLQSRLGYTEDAWWALEEALAVRRRTLGDTHPEVSDSLRRLLALAGEKKDRRGLDVLARMLHIQVSASSPEHPIAVGILFRKATFFHELGDHSRAEELLRSVLAMRERLHGTDSPLTAATQVALARVQMSMGRYREAEATCWEAWTVQSSGLGRDHETTLSTGALLAQIREHLGGAVRSADPVETAPASIVEASPEAGETPSDEDPVARLTRQIAAHESAALLNARGVLQLERDHAEQALADFIHASRIDRGHLPSRINRMIVLLRTGRDEEARFAIEDALTVAPELVLLHLQGGLVKCRVGQAKEALFDVARACLADVRGKRGPTDSVARMLEQALVHLRAGRSEDAWWMLDAAAARDRDDAHLAILLAIATERMGNGRRAVQHLDDPMLEGSAAEPLVRFARVVLFTRLRQDGDADDELTWGRLNSPEMFDPSPVS